MCPNKCIRRDIRQKLHGATLFTSSFGRKCTVEKGFYRPSTQVWEDDKGEIVHFLRCTSFFCVSVHIFGRNCTCVRSREKKILLPLILLYYICMCLPPGPHQRVRRRGRSWFSHRPHSPATRSRGCPFSGFNMRGSGNEYGTP